jgi:hypothetical protein
LVKERFDGEVPLWERCLIAHHLLEATQQDRSLRSKVTRPFATKDSGLRPWMRAGRERVDFMITGAPCPGRLSGDEPPTDGAE